MGLRLVRGATLCGRLWWFARLRFTQRTTSLSKAFLGDRQELLRLTCPFAGGAQALGGLPDAIFRVVGVCRVLHEGQVAGSEPNCPQRTGLRFQATEHQGDTRDRS